MAINCRRAQILLAVALLAPALARAQFVGFQAQQTTTQVAFTAQACAGVGAGVSFNVRNIGQSVHYVLYQTTGPINSLAIQLEGSRDGTAGSFFRISETANSSTVGGVFATIYLPIVRVTIASCTGTGTISATYSGTNVAAGSPVGIFTSSGTYNKDVAIGRAANANATFTVPLPNGGTGGAIYFTYSAATCAGSTMTFTAGPDATHQITLLNAQALANVATTQAFSIPAIPATVGVVTYTSGCALSAATYDLSFSVGERIVTANVTANFQGGGVIVPSNPDFSCQLRQDIQFTALGAGATQIILGTTQPDQQIRICHLSFALDSAADVQILRGTGANCVVAPANLTGAYPSVLTFTMDYGSQAALTSGLNGTDVCINVSAAATVAGVAIYAQF